MPSQVDTPSGPGTTFDWGLWGSASSKLTAVATNDGDTSVAYASSGGRKVLDLYTFPVLVGVVTPVSAASLTGIVRKYANGVGGQSLYSQWNSVRVGANQWSALHGATYATIVYSAAGAELALAAVNGQHGMEFWAAGGPSAKAEVWLTHLYRTVTFTYNTGGAGEFAFLIGSLVGAFIGPGLLLCEMPRLSAFMRARARKWLLPGEYETAWRAWRNCKHARSLCLNG